MPTKNKKAGNQSIQSRFYRSLLLRVFLPVTALILIFLVFNLRLTVNRTIDLQDYQNEETLTGAEDLLETLWSLSNYVVMDKDIRAILSDDFSLHPGQETLLEYRANQEITNRLTTLLHMNNNISSLYLFPANGNYYSAVDFTSTPDLKIEDFDFYNTVRNGGGRIITQIVRNNPVILSHQDTLVIGRSIIDPLKENELKGVFMLNIPLPKLTQAVLLSSEESYDILSWQDDFLRTTPLSDSDISALKALLSQKRVRSSTSPASAVLTLDGIPSLLRISPPDVNGIRIINVLALSRLVLSLLPSAFPVLLITVLAVFLMLKTAHKAVRDITVPIITLKDVMEKAYESDDYSTIDPAAGEEIRSLVSSNDEIGVLAETYGRLTEHIRYLIGEITREEKEKARIELLSLQSQINPHFIYNTLESIKVMAHMQGAVPVAEMIDRFSSFLRYCARNDKNLVTLKEELEIAQNYMDIMNLRYLNSFAYTCQVPERLHGCIVPKFILQPILENSIKHGFAQNSADDCRIDVSAGVMDGDLIITISDNGAGIAPDELDKILNDADHESNAGKIGMYNINQRIHLMYKGDYGLFAESIPGKYTTVTYRLPLNIQEEAPVPDENPTSPAGHREDAAAPHEK